MAGSVVRIEASTQAAAAACPGCGVVSERVHSRYHRQLLDAGVAGREMLIRLRVRRLFCVNIDCARKTFAEQVPRLAARHARRSTVLDRLLKAVALALGGRAGARLTRRLRAAVSRMTLLRLVRALPDPAGETPRVLGVDDFALRRGHRYGTVLIDIESGRPVDVLTSRTADTLRAWLQDHPGVEVICRDRGGAYAEGARTGAPDALAVADRWHVWNNLGGAVERTVSRHRMHLRAAAGHDAAGNDRMDAHRAGADILDDCLVPQPPVPAQSVEPQVRTDRIAIRTRQRYLQVHALLGRGLAIRAIGARLGLARGTVRRFARADTVEELLVNHGTGRRSSLLEEFRPYLHRRFEEGVTNAAQLLVEITHHGYRGSYELLRDYLRPFRTTGHATPSPPAPPTVRRVTGWIMTDPQNMDPDDQQVLDAVLARSPALAALAAHVRAFATMMCQLRGRELEAWLAAVEADELPALRSFAVGVRRDQDAVTAGLTLPWNSGPVEGQVNRIKMLKRQMFGRANHDLLRKRVLLTD